MIDVGEIDVGVVCGFFDYGVVGVEEIFFFGVFDYVEGCVVFDWVFWVYEFGFVEDFVVGLGGEVV